MKTVAPVQVWPSGDGWTVGVLRASPEQLRASHAIRFRDGADDLDAYVLAALRDPQVGQLWLFRHCGSPLAGTEVRVDVGVPRDAALAAVARQLDLGSDAYEWLTGDALSPLAPEAMKQVG